MLNSDDKRGKRLDIIQNTDERAIRQNEGSGSNRFIETLFSVALKVVAILVLLLSIVVWSRVLGFHSPDIQAVFAADHVAGLLLGALAILMPVLSIGLWLQMSWGLILWAMMGGGLVLMNALFSTIPTEIYVFGVLFGLLLIVYCLALAAHAWYVTMAHKRERASEPDESPTAR